MRLGCMHFRAPHATIKQKNYHNSQNVQPIVRRFHETLPLDCLFKTIGSVLSLLSASFTFPVFF